MNIVTVAPRRVLMPDDCPKTKEFYEKNGIQVAGLLNIPELRHGGGGLACATGILERKRTRWSMFYRRILAARKRKAERFSVPTAQA